MSVLDSYRLNSLGRFIVRWRAALLVALLSLGATSFVSYLAWRNQVKDHHRQVQERVTQLTLEVSERLNDYEIALEMARGLFMASDEVTAEEWRNFCTSERFFKNIPGTYGFAYVDRVKAQELDGYVREVRSRSDPDFDVFDTTLYEPVPYDDYCVIRYNEPMFRNANTIGLNVASIPASHDTMRRSVLDDRVAVSQGFSLHQTGAAKVGVVLYLPLFEHNADTRTAESRLESVSGWVAMSVEMSAFMAGIWPEDWEGVSSALVQRASGSEDRLLYRHSMQDQGTDWMKDKRGGGLYQASLPVNDWQWVLYVHESSPNARIAWSRVFLVGGASSVISLLLVLLVWSLTRTRDRAKQLADALTLSLRESEQRYALAVHGSNDGLWDWDLATGRVYYAPRWKELLGVPDDEVIYTPEAWFSRISSGCLARFHAKLTDHIQGKSERFDIELEMHHADGSTRWMLCRAAAVRDDDGKAMRISGSLADISELKQAQDELRVLAHHDQLTGLANRSLFTDRLNHAIARAKRNSSYRYAVLFLDFDGFKIINDSLGHSLGDKLLSEMAERIRSCVREVDTVARFGGDEFVVLMDGIHSADDVQVLSQRLLDHLAVPFKFETSEVISTVSIGVVVGTENYEDADEVIRDADAAMYQAKAGGRAQYCLFDLQMHTQAVRRMRLEQDLRQCSFDEQFQVYYQPIVDLESGTTVGFEALLRWDHPEHGRIEPDEFIGIAEESGLIVSLGEWVLRESCKQMAAWRARFDDVLEMSINVNLSRRQMLSAEIFDVIDRVLVETGLPAQALKLEVTESAVMDNPQAIVSVMQRIHKLGVRLAMDDFGTGHSSLSCLHQFPIDQLKIDRSFIENMQEHREFAAVMDAIVSLAHFLRLEVVAEGIENAEQLSQLQAMDCQYAQGFFFAKPMAASVATNYLAGFRDDAIEAA